MAQTINTNYDATTLATYIGLKAFQEKAPDVFTELIYCKTNIGGVFFDGFFDIEHRSDLKITSHPVQLGASVSDHAYMEPVEVTMTVRMSDCNEDIVLNQFASNDNGATYTTERNQNAFAILQGLQRSRVPMMVNTRLRRYENMLIKSISAQDDGDRLFGLEATVTLQEVIVAQAETVKTVVSKRQQTTDSTDSGVDSGDSNTTHAKDIIDIAEKVVKDTWDS